MKSAATATLLSALFLGNLVTAKPHPKKSLHPKVEWLDCSTNVPLNIQAVINSTTWDATVVETFGPLPDTLKCGSVKVPMDYSRSMEEGNEITVAFTQRVSSTKGARPLFFNQGGPGPSSQFIGWGAALNLTFDGTSFSTVFEGLDDFDLIVPDIRGTGGSNLLNCSIDLYPSLNVPHPESEAEFKELQKASAAFAQYCEENTTPKGFIKYAGAYEAMHDWNQIRIAMGFDKIDLLGISYGTYYGPQYGRLFPETVGRFTLDAVFATGQSDIDVCTLESLTLTRTMDRLDAFCLQEESCPFYGEGKGSVQAAYAGLLNATSDPSLNLTKYDVQSALYGAITGFATNFTEITSAIYAAANGDVSVFASSDPITQETANSVVLNCPDERIDNNTFAGHQAIRKAMAKVDPYDIDQNEYLTAIEWCSGWPYPGRPKVDFHTDLPYVYVSADFDVECPPEQAVYMKKRSPHATFILRHGDGHGTIEFPDLYARQLELAYMKTGEVPDSTNTTLASVYRQGPSKEPALDLDPYTELSGALAGTF